MIFRLGTVKSSNNQIYYYKQISNGKSIPFGISYFTKGDEIMSDNWVVRNLENALETWNDKLTEIWGLLTATHEEFKGGKIWNVILDINGALQVIGTALLVLFFVVGVMKTCGSFAEVKKPEHALRLFIRFALAKGAITYGLDLMLSLFKSVQGTISTIMASAGFGQANETTLPQEMITAIEICDFFESIPLWAVTLIGSLLITVLSFIMIMTVYGRFFKLYMYTAIVPNDVFDKVQEMIAVNKRAPSRHKAVDDYLLTTKLYCGKCKSFMVGERKSEPSDTAISTSKE